MGKLIIPSDEELKARSYRVMRDIWSHLPVGEEVETKDSEVGDRLGLHRSQIADHRRLFQHLGLMTSRNFYTGGGRQVAWKLLVDEAEAYRRLDAHFAAGGVWNVQPEKAKPKPTPKKVALADIPLNGADETIAIAGPDPEKPLAALAPARKSEGAALIEAARQYRDRDKAIITHLEAIEALGIKVDRAAALGAIDMPADERLDAVSDVLDYVTELENKVEKAERQIGNLQTERRDLLAKVTEIDSLKRANRVLSESNAQLRGQINGNS